MCKQYAFEFETPAIEEIASKYSEREIFVGLRWKARHLPPQAIAMIESIADHAIKLKRKAANESAS